MYDALFWFFECDILNFAFLVFLFFALVTKLRLKNIVVLAIAIGFMALGYLVPNYITDNIILSNLIGWIFWQDAGYSFFPFAQWIIYPVVGYLFGQVLIKTADNKKLYKKILVISIIGFLIITAIHNIFDIHAVDRFYSVYAGLYFDHNFIISAWILFGIGIELAILYFLTMGLKDTNPILRCATSFSKKVTSIYCIQWGVICALDLFTMYLDVVVVSYQMLILIWIVCVLSSYFISTLYLNWKKKFITHRQRLKENKQFDD